MDEEGSFTLTWEIENFDIFLRADDGVLVSAPWKMDTTEGTAVWWYLRAYHCRSKLGIQLLCLNQMLSPDKCEFSFFSSWGELVRRQPSCHHEGLLEFWVEKDYLKSNKVHSIIDYQDTLTLYCKMKMKAMNNGGFRIHSVVQKTNLTWNIKDANLFRPKSLLYSHNTIIEKNNLLINMSLDRKSKSDKYYVCAGLLPIIEGCFSFVICKIVSGGRLKMTETKYYEREELNRLRTEFKKTIVVPDASDRLKLHLESIVAHHNVCKYQILCPTSSQIVKAESIPEAVIGPLSEDLLHLYRERILSDATINTEGKSFSAHRNILAARSPVFRAMFEKDEMNEGRSGVVDIDDLNSETMDRMLVFLYGDSLEGVQWEEASALYYAADKYAIQPLKEKCTDILKAGLLVSNACDVLVLADTHSDEQLTGYVIDFIRTHTEVISSKKWEELEESNTRLAAKITREILLKKFEA